MAALAEEWWAAHPDARGREAAAPRATGPTRRTLVAADLEQRLLEAKRTA